MVTLVFPRCLGEADQATTAAPKTWRFVPHATTCGKYAKRGASNLHDLNVALMMRCSTWTTVNNNINNRRMLNSKRFNKLLRTWATDMDVIQARQVLRVVITHIDMRNRGTPSTIMETPTTTLGNLMIFIGKRKLPMRRRLLMCHRTMVVHRDPTIKRHRNRNNKSKLNLMQMRHNNVKNDNHKSKLHSKNKQWCSSKPANKKARTKLMTCVIILLMTIADVKNNMRTQTMKKNLGIDDMTPMRNRITVIVKP